VETVEKKEVLRHPLKVFKDAPTVEGSQRKIPRRNPDIRKLRAG
jgi:hypothetical protein